MTKLIELTPELCDLPIRVWLDGVDVSDDAVRVIASPFQNQETFGIVEMFTEPPLGIGETLEEAVGNALEQFLQGKTTSGVTELHSGLIHWQYAGS